MSGTTLILGCGYAGCELAQRIGFGGRAVFGTTRSDQRSMVIRSRGAEPVILDTSDLSPLGRLKGRVDAIVDCIPPTVDRDGSWEDPTLRIMDYVSGWDLRAFVYVSSTSVYGDHEGGRVDEAACDRSNERESREEGRDSAIRFRFVCVQMRRGRSPRPVGLKMKEREREREKDMRVNYSKAGGDRQKAPRSLQALSAAGWVR